MRSASVLGMKGMVATGYTMVWCGDLLVFMMAPLANGLKLASEIQGRRRLLFWGIIAVMLIALVGSVCYTIELAYAHGSMNLLISDNTTRASPRVLRRRRWQILRVRIGPATCAWAVGRC